MSRPGEQAPVKPNRYSEEEIAALAAFVASLGHGPAIPAEADYTPANLTEEDLARGGDLFRTNCSACHNFEGAGGALPNGKYAPSLVGAVTSACTRRWSPDHNRCRSSPTRFSDPRTSGRSSATSTALHERPSDGGFALGGLGPVSEGLWAWIIGLGILVAFAIWIAAKGVKAK